jgi:hypothetical protein
MIDETNRIININPLPTSTLCEASFAFDGCFCSVDILRFFKDGCCPSDSLEMIEVKSSTGPKSEYLDDMAFQYHVLASCGHNVQKISLMHVNTKYVRQGELDIQKLFTVVDCTEEVKAKQKEVIANIKRIRETAEAVTEPDAPLGNHCSKPNPCPYKNYCFRHITQEPGRPPAVTIDKPAIQAFLDTLSYPLYFLDFETMQEIIPPFDNTRPYQQIPFQYSLHVQYRGGMYHYEYLAEAGSDPRRAVAERLCKDIPKDVCVLAYVMSFEKGRIKELAESFPDLADHLMAIHGNVKDLIVPFRAKAWRSEAQHGSNSIKDVLPAMFPDNPELDYHRLDLVHNGNEAMAAYADLPNKSPKEQDRIRAALLAYCRLDTLAMVKILHELRLVADDIYMDEGIIF